MIYLDNAATTGTKPKSVINAVNYALENLSANPGRGSYERSNKAAMSVFECRKTIKDFVGAESENNVCFTLNCTQAINMVLQGTLKSGDHVIISSLEHNAVVRPVYGMFSENGVEYSIAEVSEDDDKTVENFKNLIKDNTKMIFVTAASNVTGKTLPVFKLGILCKERGILFGVDGAQAVGILPVDMDKMNIDYLCIAPHKGFYAPMGSGVLVAKKSIEKVLIKGGTGVNSLEVTQPEELPERVESGTVNLPGIFGVLAGVNFVKNRGLESIYKHEINLCQYCYDELSKIGAELYTKRPENLKTAPVISFNFAGKNSIFVAKKLAENNIAVRSGLHCAPLAHKQIKTLLTGTVRVSPSVFNTKADIDALIFTLKRVI